MLRRLPKSFFDDHCQRFETFPIVHDESARFVWVDDADPYWDNLIADARHYADVYGPDAAPQMVRAAKRLLECVA